MNYLDLILMLLQAAWSLGNIAGDSQESRNTVLQAGALQPLLEQFREGSKVPMLHNYTFALKNLCRDKAQVGGRPSCGGMPVNYLSTWLFKGLMQPSQ